MVSVASQVREDTVTTLVKDNDMNMYLTSVSLLHRDRWEHEHFQNIKQRFMGVKLYKYHVFR